MVSGVLTASELERAFQKERARVDRNEQCFSVVVFHVESRREDDLRRTAEVLLGRVREYDDVGVIDPDRIAVLLPEVSGSDSWTFADNAIVQLGEAELAVNCEVYTYPHPDSESGSDLPGAEMGDASRVHRPHPTSGQSAEQASGGDIDPLPPTDQEASYATNGTGNHSGNGSAPVNGGTPMNGSHSGRRPTGGNHAAGRANGRDWTEVRAFGVTRGASMVAALHAPAKATSQATEIEPPRLRAVSGGGIASTITVAQEIAAGEPAPAMPRRIHDLAELFEEPLPLYRRAVDVMTASTAILMLSPVLLAAAVAVKTTSPGPLIFAQWRAGRGGRPFRFYKFRSMYADAEARQNELRLVNEKDGPIFKMKNDPRITPVGKIIRKLSVDELPQLFNVLRGDMTLVGPRPPVMDEVTEYERWQRQRLEVTGGITCIWQVSGRSEVTFKEWMRMDVRYRKKRSLGLDLKLIWKTFGAVFSGKGAY